MMKKLVICHFLIGLPASGKSTFAQVLAEEINAVVVSTDEIRAQLYGDAANQGIWADIEVEVLDQIKTAVEKDQPVIYDATNVMRPWRLDFLYKTVNLFNIQWIGWHLQTSVEKCKQRNQQRDRQVPDEVIDKMNANLQENPPESNEGLLKIYPVPVKDNNFDLDEICTILTGFKRLLANIANLNKNKVFHPYSRLLDFERLMHLMSVIINYPGIGNLAETEPENLKEILEVEELPQFSTSIEEICAVITKKYHAIYAHPKAIEKDLYWLEKNGILARGDIAANLIEIESIDYPYLISHRYNDLEKFQRLIKTIRFIVHHPFLCEENSKPSVTTETGFRQTSIVKAMYNYGLFSGKIDIENKYQRRPLENNFREDICHCIKPYQLLPNFAMKKGYFAGTGILSQYELNKLYQSLRSHSVEKYFKDPLAAEIYDIFKQRLENSKLLEGEAPYSTRLIGTKSIVDVEKYQQQFEQLEEAIKKGEFLKFSHVQGTANWSDQQPQTFTAYPLQIVFHNIAWYLGYEIGEGDKKGLFAFARIDRIRFQQVNTQRDINEQKKALDKLHKLYDASAGIYLGDDVAKQRQYLDSQQGKKLNVTVILYATELAFKFICEGNQRFQKIEMSLPDWLKGTSYERKALATRDRGIFKLDQNIPPYQYTIKVTVPEWSLMDIDLIRWISGWGKEVKVIEPQSLVDRIYSIGEGITNIYQDIELICCDLEKVNDLVKNKEGSDYRFISIKTPNGNAEPQSVQSELNMNPGRIHPLIINDITQFNEEDIKKTVAFIKKKKKASKIVDGLRFLIYSHSGINLASEVAITIYRELKQDTELTNLRISLNYL